MHQFLYSSEDFILQVAYPDEPEDGQVHLQLSEFDELLRCKWDAAVNKGYFRYQLDEMQTKILPGSMKLVAQLNTKRATDRRKPQKINHVNQPFNPDIFNFTKVDPKEILFELSPRTILSDSSSMNHEGSLTTAKYHSIIINVSPLEYCNILLVPNRLQCYPQYLTEDALNLALQTMLLSAHWGFNLGFNSLCAFASVNHQHFHGYYLEHELAIRKAATRQIIGPFHELVDWPVRGFIFQVKGHSLQETARSVYKVASILQQREIAHNVFITRGNALDKEEEQTVRVILWPRQSYIGSKSDRAGPEVAFNAAVCELAGHIPIFNKDGFDRITEASVVDCLHGVSLSQETFTELKEDVKSLFQD